MSVTERRTVTYTVLELGIVLIIIGYQVTMNLNCKIDSSKIHDRQCLKNVAMNCFVHICAKGYSLLGTKGV